MIDLQMYVKIFFDDNYALNRWKFIFIEEEYNYCCFFFKKFIEMEMGVKGTEPAEKE